MLATLRPWLLLTGFATACGSPDADGPRPSTTTSTERAPQARPTGASAPWSAEERATIANLRARLVRGHVPQGLRTADRASAIVALAHDPSDPVARAAALEALPDLTSDATRRAALGPRDAEVVPAIVAALDDPDRLVRGTALHAAIAWLERGDRPAPLLDALHTVATRGRWPEARADILRATLRASGSPPEPRFVELALAQLAGEDPRARVVVLEVLPVGPDGVAIDRARAAFEVAAGAREPMVRAHALARLTELGALDAESCRAARRFAALALDDPDPALRALGACTLRRLGAGDAAARLAALAADATPAELQPLLTVDAWGASALVRGPRPCAPTVAAAAAFTPAAAASACP